MYFIDAQVGGVIPTFFCWCAPTTQWPTSLCSADEAHSPEDGPSQSGQLVAFHSSAEEERRPGATSMLPAFLRGSSRRGDLFADLNSERPFHWMHR